MAGLKNEKNKRKRWWAFTMFLGIMMLHGFGILLFARGFLLTRNELSQYSQCSEISQSPCNVIDQGDGCWTKPAIDRLVIIVFDALRFDFVAPSTFFEDKKPWMDKLQVVHKLATQRGSSARLFKAIADPPTTSLQRLKGLTTGGLPTFIDVGNSFGAPAIIEDNFMYQLAQNGKRVVMMGDDTWVQLFPHHFNMSYPFPSFNVKDLHTVDNGCIEHLFPSLYKEDWDVLIAHFLGVDHAGHISSVDSTSMIEKLEQYNGILENIVEVLDSQSGPGGLHQNTMLLVMGDHGQTVNGDHGGGSAEEVETAVFAFRSKKSPSCLLSEIDTSSCQFDVEGRKLCVSTFQQLDFAVTVSALLGVPFPFGSLGRVNPELYALATSECWNQSGEEWMQNYASVLCVNSWQVKRYIDVYSASSLIGFSDNDLMHITDLYSEAKAISSHSGDWLKGHDNGFRSSLPKAKMRISAYSNFLANVAGIARSKWTEFNLKMMTIGFSILLTSIFLHISSIKRMDNYFGLHFSSSGDLRISIGVIFAFTVVLIRSSSLLSNSFILEEGKVASFLLATTGMLNLRNAIAKKKMLLEALVFVLLIPFLRFGIELGQSKQAINSLFLKVSHSWMLGVNGDSFFWKYAVEILPILALIILAYILCKSITCKSFSGIVKYVIPATVLSYSLIALFWALDSNILNLHMIYGGMEKNLIPRTIYVIGLLEFSLLVVSRLSTKETTDWEENIIGKALAMLSSWSPTVILLSGKQGPLVALASIIGGWCIIRLMRLEQDTENGCNKISAMYASPTIQWSLLSVCLFFCTGHWCAFDGLRYAAAFIGFDEFNIIRQAVLLTIETFGFYYILPILGLPLLLACQHRTTEASEEGTLLSKLQLCQVYLIYGLTKAIESTFTILCVAIQRRHLMVWGLFAPKFVFDVAGLLLSDFLILLASVYYIPYNCAGRLVSGYTRRMVVGDDWFGELTMVYIFKRKTESRKKRD